jgi:hypothetical protein
MKLKTKTNYNKWPSQIQNEQNLTVQGLITDKPHAFSRPEYNLGFAEKKKTNDRGLSV